MKQVRLKRGGFFYAEANRQAGDELEVPDNVAAVWIDEGVAETTEPNDQQPAGDQQPEPEKKGGRRSKQGPAENTADSGPAETA